MFTYPPEPLRRPCATILNPQIGYAAAAEAAKESVRTGKSIQELVVGECQLLSDADMDAIVGNTKLTRKHALKYC